jgi:STE24 endopeptidase
MEYGQKGFPMQYNAVFWVIVAITIVQFAWSQILAALNRSRMSDEMPPELAGIYEPEEYARQQQYQRTNSKVNLIEQSIMTVLMLIVLFSGALGRLENLVAQRLDNPIIAALAFVAMIAVILGVASIPFSYYDTFTIEERFGFNKTTRPLFWRDTLVSLLLTLVLASVVVGLIVYFIGLSPQWWWLWAWGALTLFSVGLNYFYSELIVPLFNKQTPLEDGELRDDLLRMAQRTEFRIADVYLIDGSKRSTKANAYFAGFGNKKRICLYDTITEQLDADEISAVLAHEIGHYKKRHVPQMMVIGVLLSGLQLYLMSLLLKSPQLATALGSRTGEASIILGIIAFGMLFGPISELLGMGQNLLSRHNEYQADTFADRHGYGAPLIGGLKKISAQALSNLTPHPLVVFWEYSHPTLLQRMENLSEPEG